MVHLTPFEETVAGQEFIQEGRQRGRIEARRESLVAVLEARFGDLPEPLREAIR